MPHKPYLLRNLMTFANTDAFLLLLLLVPLAVIKIVADTLAKRRLRRIAGPKLLPGLRRGGWRGRDLLVFWFEALALTFFIAALARPQWGHTEREIQGEGRSIIVAIDTSRSMLADDLKPDRLTRAKLAAQDLIASLPGDKIGLIAFAGRAFVQAPLTTDHEALLEALSQFDTELIPRGGSNLSEPIELAAEVFDKADTASHALIMFSDGDELEGRAAEVARQAREKNIMIVAVGTGTREGALLLDDDARNRRGFIRDETGRPVRSRLEDGVLESLARETGGLYLNLSSASSLKERVQVILNKLDRSKTAAQKDKRQPIERFQWALIPGMACLVIAFILRLGRRLKPARAAWPPPSVPATAAALLLALAASPAAQAGVLIPGGEAAPSPWQSFQKAESVTGQATDLTEEQEAQKRRIYQAITEQFGEKLAESPSPKRTAELEFGRGASLFREKEHDAAIDAFGQALASPDRALQAEAAYNLGNSLADKAKTLPKQRNRMKQMIELVESAIRHYDEALQLQPGHENARINRDLLKDYLPKLQEAREEKLRQSRERKKQEKEKGEEGEEQDQGQQGQQNQQGNEGEEGQEGQQGQQGTQGQNGQGEGDEDIEEDEEGEGAEGDGEQPGGDEGEEQQGQGQSGQGSSGSGGGQGQNDREQSAPEGFDDQRSGERQGEGELQAKGGEGGKDGQEKNGRNGRAEKRNQQTGFSRSEARNLLRALSDEDYVRPLTDRAMPEGRYKNW